MISHTEENYLKAMCALTAQDGKTSVNEVSKHLAIKMPTVNSMMKRLAEKGLVLYESYKPLRMTEEGKKQAALVIRKHRLTEMYLVEKMGFGWEEVHSIAEQIEHIHAPKLFEKMDELLGFPKFDPHGSPIPDREGNITSPQYTKLSDCKEGDMANLTAIADSSHDFLQFLNSKNIALGTTFVIDSIESYDGIITVMVDGHRQQTFSRLVSDKLLMKPMKD